MPVIFITLRIRPEHVREFERTLREHVRATRRSEPGCVTFDVSLDAQRANTYHIYEVYADQEALAAHAQSPTRAALRDRLPDWIEESSRTTATLLVGFGA